MAAITLITDINAPVDVCFNLSRDIDAHLLSMKDSKERAIAGVTTGLIKEGESVTWEAHHFGFRMRMTVMILEMKQPDYFIDVMTKGPFKMLRHEHRFEYNGISTIMTDVIEFKAPLSVLGTIAEFLFLKRYMRRLLEKRNVAIKDLAEKNKAPQSGAL